MPPERFRVEHQQQQQQRCHQHHLWRGLQPHARMEVIIIIIIFNGTDWQMQSYNRVQKMWTSILFRPIQFLLSVLTVNEKECERGRRLYVYFTVLIFFKFVIVCKSTNIARISLKFGLRYQHCNVYETIPICLLLTTLQFATLILFVFCVCV